MSTKSNFNILARTKHVFSILAIVGIVTSVFLFSQIARSINAEAAGSVLGTGLSTSSSTCTPPATDAGAAIRCVWTNGSIKDSLDSLYNVGVTALNPNSAPAKIDLDSRHDTFTYTTTYIKNDTETDLAGVRFDLTLGRQSNTTIPVADMIEVVSVTNQWDADRDGVFENIAEEKDTSIVGTGYNADLLANSVYINSGSVNKPISIRPSVGAKCTSKMADGAVLSVTDSNNSTYNVGYGTSNGTGCNINGAFPGATRGKVTVVFGIKSGASENTAGSLYLGVGEVRSGKCILDNNYCDTSSKVNVSGMVMYTKYTYSADELNPNVPANVNLRKTNGNSTALPAAGDTTYSIVVGDTSPIKAMNSSNLNIGTCTMGSTVVNITGGKCVFTVTTSSPLTTGQIIPAGTVTISDGATPKSVTSTLTYSAYTVGGAANVNPTISITSPTAGSKIALSTQVTIAATAADSDGTISKVEFYLGNTLLGEDTTSPYTYSWTPTGLSTGNYTITAKATDNSLGNTTSTGVSVSITKPLSTPDDIINILFKCDDAKIASKTKCTFTIPDFRTLPSDFKITIGESDPSGTCTQNVNLVTCTDVNTGLTPGILPIYTKIGSGEKTDTGEKVTISLPDATVIRTGGQAIIALMGVVFTGGLGYIVFQINKKRKLKIF